MGRSRTATRFSQAIVKGKGPSFSYNSYVTERRPMRQDIGGCHAPWFYSNLRPPKGEGYKIWANRAVLQKLSPPPKTFSAQETSI
jgi:hypothetical protein